MSKLWCEKHDHFKRSCPWCEIEELEQEIKQLKQRWIIVKEALDRIAKGELGVDQDGLYIQPSDVAKQALKRLEGE